jgi:hypothetical protein
LQSARITAEYELNERLKKIRAEIAAEKEKAEAAAKTEEAERGRDKAFDQAYHDWLRALAELDDPTEASGEEWDRRLEADCVAERRLMTTPASRPEQVWKKLEAFEVILSRDLTVGPRTDSILMLALGSIKQDILNLDLCD